MAEDRTEHIVVDENTGKIVYRVEKPWWKKEKNEDDEK